MDKTEARAWGKQVRAGLAAAQKAELDGRIVAQAKEGLDWARHRRVHMFLPIRRLGEIDTWPLLAWIWREQPGTQVYVPRLGGGISQVLVTPETRFEVNVGGIPEPVGGRELGAGKVDLVLVPLLAFDQRGGRVGYGGGFYDRFLATQPNALRMGVAYEGAQTRGQIALEGFDVRLHGVVTEDGVRRF